MNTFLKRLLILLAIVAVGLFLYSHFVEDIFSKRLSPKDTVKFELNDTRLEVLYNRPFKKGKNYVCLCPFHNDTNPSMIISQEKQIYKCFSCGAGGNVLTFVQNYEKISFENCDLFRIQYRMLLKSIPEKHFLEFQ